MIYRVTGKANFGFYDAATNMSSDSDRESVDVLVSAFDLDDAKTAALIEHLFITGRNKTVIRLQWDKPPRLTIINEPDLVEAIMARITPSDLFPENQL